MNNTFDTNTDTEYNSNMNDEENEGWQDRPEYDENGNPNE